jgi:outer membrane protein assembly factor BamB/tetratricopeptide (TPR) repeat protein
MEAPVSRRRPPAARAACAAALLLAALAAAQEAPAPNAAEEEALFNSYALPDSRQAREIAGLAQKAVDGKRFSDAAAGLRRILDLYPNRVFRVAPFRYEGGRAWVLRMLKEWPPQVLEAYRGLSARAAREPLARARAARDLRGLDAIIERHPMTAEAAEALEALGDLYEERGATAEAARAWREAFDAGRATARPKLAIALARLGHLADARELRAGAGTGTIQVAGHDVPLAQFLDQAIAAATPEPAEEPAAWPVVGGDNAHTRVMPPLLSLSARQWDLGIEQPQLRGNFPYLEGPGFSRRESWPYLPVVLRNTVFVHNGIEVKARNLSTGGEKWEFPGISRSAARAIVPHLHSAAVDGDALFVSLEAVEPDRDPDFYQSLVIRTNIPKRRLFAFDAETGKILWSHAPGDLPSDLPREERTELERLDVVSSPIVRGEDVYVGGAYFEGKLHSRLCAFDRRTGRPRWMTLVCTGQQELNMFGRPFKESVGLVPAEADGVVYYCGNLGIISAVEARTGSTLWSTAYEQIPIPVSRSTQHELRPASWINNPPLIVGDVLVVAPLDSDQLLGLDRATGQVRWAVERTDYRDYRVLIGARDGRVFVSNRRVAAFQASDGRQLWEKALGGESIVGRGAVSSTGVLVATPTYVHILSPETGDPVTQPLRWNRTGEDDAVGNLLITGDYLITTSLSKLTVFFNLEETISRLEEAVGQRQNDLRARLELADALYRAGKQSRALEIYQEVRTRAEARGDRLAADARRGVFHSARRLGQEALQAQRPDQAEACFQAALQAAESASQRLDISFDLEETHLQRRDYRKLIDFYQALARDHPRELRHRPPLGEARVGLYALYKSAETRARLSDPSGAVGDFQRMLVEFPGEVVQEEAVPLFAAREIQRLIEVHGPSVYAEFESRAQDLFRRGTTTPDPDALQTILDRYPNSTVRERAYLALGRLLLERGDTTGALRTLRRFHAAFPQAAGASEALGQVADAYAKLGYARTAAAVARVRHELWPAEGARPPAEPKEPAPPAPEPPFQRTWEMVFPGEAAASILRPRGSPASTIRGRLHVVHGDLLHCLDTARRSILWRQPLKDQPLRHGYRPSILQEDGLLIVPFRDRVLALDSENGEAHWTAELTDRQLAGFTLEAGIVVLLLEDSVRRNTYYLRALDLASGQKIWERGLSGYGPGLPLTAGARIVQQIAEPFFVLGYDLLSGTPSWKIPIQRRLSPYLTTALLLPGHRAFFVRNEATLFVFDTNDGRTLATMPSPGGEVGALFQLPGERVGVFVRGEPTPPTGFRQAIKAYRTGDLSPIWEHSLGLDHPYLATEYLVDEQRLYFPLKTKDEKHLLRALNAEDGRPAWEATLFEGPGNPNIELYLTGPFVLALHDVFDFQRNEHQSTLRILRRQDGKELQTIETRGAYQLEAIADPSGLMLLNGNQLTLHAAGPGK